MSTSPEVDIQSLVADQVSSGLDVDQILAKLGKRGRLELARGRVEEERRRIEERIRYYEPFDYTGGQLDAHRSTKKVRLIVAPNRSGKTTFDVAEVCFWATGTHPYRETPKPPVRMRVCCTDFLNGIEKVMIPTFKEFVKREDLRGGSWELAYSKEQRTLNWSNGSFVEFMSYDQEVGKFGGVKRHLIIEDEPAPQDIHGENVARLIDYKGELIMTLTPVNLSARTSWIYDFWLSAEGDEDVECFFFDIFKNRALSKEVIEKFVNSIRGEAERMARIEGKFPQLSGLIYKNFSRGKHVVKPFEISSERGSIYIAIDPHMRKSTGVIFGYVDRNGDRYIWDELKVRGTAKVLVDRIKLKLGSRRLQWAVMDDSAKSPNEMGGERSIWEEFLDPDRDGSDRGIYSMTVSGKTKDVSAGIRLVEDHLGLDEIYQKPRLFIFENCPETIHEFETYLYDDYKFQTDRPVLEKPRKVDDDLMDCIRYWLMSNPIYVKARSGNLGQKHQYSYLTGEIIG